MLEELKVRRRMLVQIQRRYAEADRDWARAIAEASRWFPATPPHPLAPIGNPGSHVREVYDARDRALAQLGAARAKLHAAQARAGRRDATRTRTIHHRSGPI